MGYGLPYGRFQRRRKEKEGRRWFTNFGIAALAIHEGRKPDEKQMVSWVKQVAKLPGWLV